MWRTSAFLAVAVASTIVSSVSTASAPLVAAGEDRDPCTSAFYWEHHGCPLPALVALDDIVAVTGVDSITPIDRPQFGSLEDAPTWLEEDSPLLVVSVRGVTRAYPVAILVFHEVVNDVIGGVPVLVTYCPLCNSGVVFDRRVRIPDGSTEVLDFGTSGHVFRSNLVLYDRQHENFWLQLSGTAVAGEPFGSARTELERISSNLLGLATLRELAPDAQVLSPPADSPLVYGRNPYPGYDSASGRPFLYEEGPVDERLPQMARVVGVDGADPVAVPETVVRDSRTLEVTAGGPPVTLWWAPGQAAALEASTTAAGRDVGQVVAFEATLAGIGHLRFEPGDAAGTFVDDRTRSQWNLLGRAVDGPLAGRQLVPADHVVTFWFAWFAFHPDTGLLEAPGRPAPRVLTR